MENEIWKDVLEYEGLYHISNLGRIRSLNYNNTTQIKIRKLDVRGMYLAICLCRHNIKTKYSVHRLVAINFIENPQNKPEVNHIDGNKMNNHVDNLEWVTTSENRHHAFNTGLQKSAKYWTGRFGKDHNLSKEVNQYDKNGVFVNKFYSTCEAKRLTGINQSNISACVLHKRKSAGGFIWQ